MFEEWFYRENNRFLPLPVWCHAYAELGQQVATYDCPDRRLHVALALPTRAYAALFVALGVVMARASQPEARDDQAYFDMLLKLPTGTSVFFYENDKRYAARKQSAEERCGRRYLRVQLDTEEARLIPENLCRQVTVSNDAEASPGPRNRKYGRDVSDENEAFVRAAVADVDATNFCRTSRLEVLFVGVKRHLREELATPLRIGNVDGGEVDGVAQDVLRVQDLLSAGQPYRSLIDTDQRGERHSESPHVVIFDSAKGFLDWRERYSASRQVVILDRTEPRFAEAVNELKRENMSRASDQPFTFDVPDAVTYMAFEMDMP